MPPRSSGSLAVLAALASVATLVVSGCSTTAPSGSTGPAIVIGDPVQGGAARAFQASEPRSMDPAAMANAAVSQGILGNALYGTLLTNDVETADLQYKMATGFVTSDGGSTFTLALREGLTFSDQTPLNAAAVKFNWDRLRDPAIASASIAQAGNIASTEVINPTTLRVTMLAPNPQFGQAIVNSSMNWIASPAALQKGAEAFNEKPIGAGPFTLTKWARQDVIELAKNPGYWDAPKPYLDSITLRTSPDSSQRINSLMTGGADFAVETNWAGLAKAQGAGLVANTVPLGGGVFMAMNTRMAPFDDIRARKAVSMAIDRNALNLAMYNGKGEVPETLFADSSPYYTGTELFTYDPKSAQGLFDALAAEGKPVSFTFTSFPTAENKSAAESVQAQLSAFENVDVAVAVVDFPTGLQKSAAFDFEMMVSSVNIQDPDFSLWNTFHSDSSQNASGIADTQLDEALAAGRFATGIDERKSAYQTVQDRLVETNPGVWYSRYPPSVVARDNVGGVEQYGLGSLLPEEVWLAN